MADLINSFPQLSDRASKVSNRVSAQIDRELTGLQDWRRSVRSRNLFWETLLLVPMTLAVVGVFTYLFGRPIRAIDRAISELGRGTFSRPIAIRGPADLERLAAQLEWLRGRLLDLAQEKNRFLRHMSHELKTPLANIREGTELLMDGAVGELQSGQREVTAILRENGMKLQRLIENLVVLQRLAGQERRPGGFRIQAAAPDQERIGKSAAHAGGAARAARRAGGGSHAARRPRQGAPDPRQPALQCHQVHAARRHHFHSRARRARTAGVGCHGQRAGHSRPRSAIEYSRPFIRERRRREDMSRARESGCRW